MRNKFLLVFCLCAVLMGGDYSNIIGASPDGRYIVYADKGRNDTVHIHDTERAQNIANFTWEYAAPRREDGSFDTKNPLLTAVLDSESRAVPLRRAYDFAVREKIEFSDLEDTDWHTYLFNDASPLGAEISTVTLFSELDEPSGKITFEQDRQKLTLTYTFNERIIMRQVISKKPYTWLRPETILINGKTKRVFTIFWVDEVNTEALARVGLSPARNYSDFSFGYCLAYSFKY